MNIHQLVERQRAFFNTGATLPVAFRKEMLQRLRDALGRLEPDLAKALAADLGKSAYESFMCEVGLTRTEISIYSGMWATCLELAPAGRPLPSSPPRAFKSPPPKDNAHKTVLELFLETA